MVIVGAILAPGGVIVALIERTRRENNRDHAYNTKLLKGIDHKVDKLDDRFNNHINWHLDKES
jgi:transcription termination factor NusB